MKHIRAKAYLGVGIYLLAGPLLQEADASIPEDDLELTLEGALTLAQIQDPSLAQIEADLKAAGQETRDVGKWRAPEFRFQVEEDNASKNHSEYAIRLRPPNPWVRRRKQQAIRREELNLHLDYARTLAELNREVSQQYFKTLFQRSVTKLAKDLVAISEVSDDIYQQGLNTGGVRFVDAIDGRLDLAEAKVRLKEAEREEGLLRGRLFRMCGLSRSDSRLLTSTFASLTELPVDRTPHFARVVQLPRTNPRCLQVISGPAFPECAPLPHGSVLSNQASRPMPAGPTSGNGVLDSAWNWEGNGGPGTGFLAKSRIPWREQVVFLRLQS